MRIPSLSLFAVLALLAAPLHAQRSTTTIRGTVSDPTGAVVPGAAVTVSNEETGVSRTTVTNSAGFYSFPELAVGRYTLKVELAGFKSGTVTGVALNVAEVRAVDVELATGDLAESVVVEAPALAVQTIGGDVSGLVTGEQVRELPLNGRNFMQLVTLMPGVSAPEFLNTRDKGLMGGSDLSVSGSSVTANLWTVDGANNNDVGSNRTILVYPSVETIEEFKIHRNSYGAEFGQSSGAQVNIVTRGGTNEFHGSAYYFGRNDALNSRSYFLEQADREKENLSFHDFGFALGGPIIKDKLHFFVSQEWNREMRGTVRTAFVPTARERAGDFSEAGVAGCSSPDPIDPLTGQPFPGGVIPADRLSPAGQLYLQLFPLPNTVPKPGTCSNWVESLDTPINWRQDSIRLDYSLSNTARLMARYTQDTWKNEDPSSFGSFWGDDPFPAVDSTWDQPGRSLVLQLNHNVGSRAINTLQFSYSANSITVTRGGTSPELNAQINSAIPPIFPDGDRLYGSDRSHPVFWGGAGYAALWNQAPFSNNQDLFVFRDDYSAVFGKHSFKAGGLFSFNKKNEDGGGAADTAYFWGAAGLNGWGATTGNVLGDFLLRDMTWGFSENSTNRSAQQRWRDLEFYVSDSWKVHPQVTLDLGLRYSNFFSPYYADDQVLSFDPSRFDPALGNDPCNGLLQPPGTDWCAQAGFEGGSPGPNRALRENATHLFAPRIGVAWDLSGNGKTALRAGLGRFYLRERLGPWLGLVGNPPFQRQVNGIRKLDSNAEPCEGCIGSGIGRPTQGVSQEGKVPSNWQWNLTLEREVAHNTLLEVSYVGNKGIDIPRVRDINAVPSASRLDYVRAGTDDATQAALRPFGVFGDASIAFWDHSGSSIYHALQTQIRSNFGRGSQFQASYTWSRLISDDPLDDSSAGLQASTARSDVENPSLDRGLARTHRKHVFNTSLVLNLPTLEQKSGFVENVFGDWQVAAIAVAASGTPITVFVGSVPGLGGGVTGTGYDDNERPNRVPGEPCRAGSGPDEQWLNPNAFTLTGFQLGSFGDSGRGVCEGPSYFSVDLALYKNIKLSERVKLQFRFEVFNVFNRVNFIGNSPTQGLNATMNPIGATLDSSLAGASQITGFELPLSFGQATATLPPRQAQFGLKLTF